MQLGMLQNTCFPAWNYNVFHTAIFSLELVVEPWIQGLFPAIRALQTMISSGSDNDFIPTTQPTLANNNDFESLLKTENTTNNDNIPSTITSNNSTQIVNSIKSKRNPTAFRKSNRWKVLESKDSKLNELIRSESENDRLFSKRFIENNFYRKHIKISISVPKTVFGLIPLIFGLSCIDSSRLDFWIEFSG